MSTQTALPSDTSRLADRLAQALREELGPSPEPTARDRLDDLLRMSEAELMHALEYVSDDVLRPIGAPYTAAVKSPRTRYRQASEAQQMAMEEALIDRLLAFSMAKA
ncbi:hypothetical protein [Paraburkholderia sp.]|uniref:hypothetical protein n=1 Tax=Paraburkholderia sp. TaxID=1926495 RepID=UPI00239100E1|nr:hypothetical protein [Paraburkholderia sp.]MDE1180134.1 hypothetical protein [Paraburkholderia sp.]